MSKLEEIISSTIYDLTHLEINTIVKDEMSASKAPSSPRLILHDLSKKFHLKLISLGEKYLEFIGTENENAVQLFRGNELFMGSAYNSFKELSLSALNANIRLTNDKKKVKGHFSEDEVNSDIKMFQRIETISNDVRRILKIVDTIKGEPTSEGETYKFDEPEFVNNFRILKSEEVKKLELKLDLRQLMLFKKANDIGTEKVILQTIIGIDGDVTTRIANAFADNPVKFINEIHNESIGISVKFWESLVNVVVKLGKSILDNVTNKK
jgi:hypothetical protein